MTRLWLPPTLLLVSLSFVSGCGEDDPRPPLLQPSLGVDNPVTCGELESLAQQPNDSGHFIVAGNAADCLSEGQWCPAEWIDSPCEAGSHYAHCVAGRWVSTCAGQQEAGDPDAGGAPDAAGDA